VHFSAEMVLLRNLKTTEMTYRSTQSNLSRPSFIIKSIIVHDIIKDTAEFEGLVVCNILQPIGSPNLDGSRRFSIYKRKNSKGLGAFCF